MERDNVSSEKPYGKLYKHFLKEVFIPGSLINKLIVYAHTCHISILKVRSPSFKQKWSGSSSSGGLKNHSLNHDYN